MDEESISAGKPYSVDQAVFSCLTSDRAGEQFLTGFAQFTGLYKKTCSCEW